MFSVPPWFSLSDMVQLDIVGMSFANKNSIFNWLRYNAYSDHSSFYIDHDVFPEDRELIGDSTLL